MLAATRNPQIPASLHERTRLRDELAAALYTSGDPTLRSLGQEMIDARLRRLRGEQGAPRYLGPRTTTSSSVQLRGQEWRVIIDVQLILDAGRQYPSTQRAAEQGAERGSSTGTSTTMLSSIQVDNQELKIIVNAQLVSRPAPQNLLNNPPARHANSTRAAGLYHIHSARRPSRSSSWRRRTTDYIITWF